MTTFVCSIKRAIGEVFRQHHQVATNDEKTIEQEDEEVRRFETHTQS